MVVPLGRTYLDSIRRQGKYNPGDTEIGLRLAEAFYVNHDVVNAYYHSFRQLRGVEQDRSLRERLREQLNSYLELSSMYEQGRLNNSEYHILVFPLAAKLEIDYIHPIYDLSCWAEYERHFNSLQARVDTDSSLSAYRALKHKFKSMVDSVSREGNLWIAQNSSVFTDILLKLEGYSIPEGINDNDFKELSHYWIERNKSVAANIDKVVRNYGKRREVVFFGASHVGAVKEELVKLRHRVLLFPDVAR